MSHRCRLTSNVNIPQTSPPLKHRCSDIATPQTYPQIVPPHRTSELILNLLPILSVTLLRGAVHFMRSSSNIPLPIGLPKAVASMATLQSTSSMTEAPSNITTPPHWVICVSSPIMTIITVACLLLHSCITPHVWLRRSRQSRPVFCVSCISACDSPSNIIALLGVLPCRYVSG